MKKTFVLFAVFIYFISGVSAQESTLPLVTISGKVTDAATGKPLEYATVVLKDIKTQKISGGITNSKGIFTVKIPKGTYEMSIEFISFKTKKLPEKRIYKNTDFGTIQLTEDTETLDEINIIAEKSTVEIRLDKRIYNVGKDMTVKGGNASDVLDNVPSVNVDVEGTVSLRGNENVRILIDGKPSALVGLSGTDVLRQLPADAIESVEVITSPSARYDAEGTAGIINIILRKGKAAGFNGAVNATVGDPRQYQLSTNLNLRTKKVNLFSNLGYNDRKGPGNSFTELTTFNNGLFNSRRIEDRLWSRKRKGYNINAGLEYFLSKNSSLTGTFFLRDSDNKNFSTNTISEFDQDGNTTANSVRLEDENEDDKTTQFSLNYTNNFNKKGQKLTADFQYSDSRETEIGLISEGTENENTRTDEISKNTLVQSDYILPVGKNAQFEAGYRGDFQYLTSDFVVNAPSLDPQFNPSNSLEFKQNINAFYTQYGSKIKKFSFLLGIRTEITNTKVRLLNTNENFDFNYTELFPTVNLGYERSETQSFTLGYSRRLRRPRFWFLNPFESRNSQNVIFKGNPGLIPTFTSSFDIGFLQKIKKFTFNSSIYYQHSVNTIQRVNRDEIRLINNVSEIVTIREPINLASEDRYGFEFTANFNPSKKVRLSGSFNFFQSETKGTYQYNQFSQDNLGNIIMTPVLQDLGNKNRSWFTRFNARITLPAKIQWETRLFYRGPGQTAQNDTKGIFSANIALSKDILKDKGTLVFNVSDVFNSRKRRTLTHAPSMENPTSISNQEFQWRQRQLSLNFTYRFNQKKKRGRPQRNRNDDVGDEEFGG
ncbi:MAG: TonB-dependent receptor [Flavobacteriaceae bacterium]|nr:MAG: TonB-dependent receptor [Flavobacteriaceae bacterium]